MWTWFCGCNETRLRESIVLKIWEPRRLTIVWAFTACYRDRFAFIKGKVEKDNRNSITEFLAMYQVLMTSEVEACSWFK
jgi:hypothetical protein